MSSALTRRHLLGSAVGAVASWPVAAQATEVADGRPVQLTEFIWVGAGQGVVPREINAEYEKAHPNVKVTLYESSNAVTFPKMVAQRQIDPKSPLVNFGYFSGDALTKGEADDMFLSLDPVKLPNVANAFDNMRFPGNKGVGFGVTVNGFLYNKKLVREPPTRWNDLFAPRFKGKVMLFDYSWLLNGFMAVAVADRPPGQTAPAIDVAFEKFSKAAQDGQFLAMFNANEQAKEALARGDALVVPEQLSFGISWNKEQPGGDGPFGYAVPKEGAVAYVGYLGIVNGSTPDQVDVASQLINITLEPDNISRYCNLTALLPTVRGAKLKPELAEQPLFAPEVVEKAIVPDFAFIAQNDAAWRQRWDRDVKARMK
jgi:putative spermidine/putrescine transport system substrate-binding protein